jgi:hypothetical protein
MTRPRRGKRADKRVNVTAGGPRQVERRREPLLSDRRAIPAIVALGVLLAVPSLWIGFYQDDYNLIAALRRGVRPFYDLFRFATGNVRSNEALIASGVYPFWIAPDFKLHLIRPLSSIVLSIDNAVFGNHPLGYHLHTLAWYAALLVGVSMLFRRVLPPASATLSLLVFALRASHTMSFAWISARHVLVAAVPSVFALLAYVRAVREGSTRALILAMGLLVLGFAGSEVALGIVPFLIGFYLVEVPAKGASRRALASIAPTVLITAAYLVAYAALGGGAHATLGYRDPIADTDSFIDSALRRIPVYLGDALLGIPAEVGAGFSLVESLGIALFAVSLCVLVFRTMSRESREQSRALAWLTPAAVLALGPGLATVWGHALVIADLGFAALIGTLLVAAIDGIRRSEGAMKWFGFAAAAFVLVVCHVLVPPILTLRSTATTARRSEISTTMAMTAELDASPAKTVLLVGAPDAITYFYARDVLETLAPERLACWSALVPSNGPYRLTRTDVNSLRLEEMEPPRNNRYSSFFAASRSFSLNDEVQQCGAKIRIRGVRSGSPTVLQIETDGSLDDERFELLGMKDFRLRRVRMPAVGQSVLLPRLDG